MSESEDTLLDVGEVAARLKVTEETVRRYLRTGALTGFRLGGRKSGWRVRSGDLQEFISARVMEARRSERGE